MEMGIRFKLVNGTVRKWELTALEWKCKNPFPVIFSLDEVLICPDRDSKRNATLCRSPQYSSPGAQFTKYLTIYRKIIVSLS